MFKYNNITVPNVGIDKQTAFNFKSKLPVVIVPNITLNDGKITEINIIILNLLEFGVIVSFFFKSMVFLNLLEVVQ